MKVVNLFYLYLHKHGGHIISSSIEQCLHALAKEQFQVRIALVFFLMGLLSISLLEFCK